MCQSQPDCRCRPRSILIPRQWGGVPRNLAATCISDQFQSCAARTVSLERQLTARPGPVRRRGLHQCPVSALAGKGHQRRALIRDGEARKLKRYRVFVKMFLYMEFIMKRNCMLIERCADEASIIASFSLLQCTTKQARNGTRTHNLGSGTYSTCFSRKIERYLHNTLFCLPPFSVFSSSLKFLADHQTYY